MKYVAVILCLLTRLYSHAQPQLITASQFAGVGQSGVQILDIAKTVQGDIVSTGVLLGSADFDNGPGAYILSSSDTNNGNIFVAKTDQAGHLIWAKVLGGYGYSNAVGWRLTIDRKRNIFVTGYFQNTIDFDPGAGVCNLSSMGAFEDAFVLKLDSSGNFIWVRQLGGWGGDRGHDIKSDSLGNIYVTGAFEGNMDADPGSGSFILHSNGWSDIWVMKLDSAGSFAWAANYGSGGWDGGMTMELSPSGHLYVSGVFVDSADFAFDTTAYIVYGHASTYDIFLLKLKDNGQLVWAVGAGGNGDDSGMGIALDKSENVYLTGRFSSTADFDPTAAVVNLTSGSVGHNIFVCSYDSSGHIRWADAFNSTSSYYDQEGFDLGYDWSTNLLYTTGNFYEAADFDPGPGTYMLHTPSVSTQNVFLSVLDGVGKFVCAGVMTCNQMSWGRTLAVDNGSVTLGGCFADTLHCDMVSNLDNLFCSSGSGYICSFMKECWSFPLTTTENDARFTVLPNPSSGEFIVNAGFSTNFIVSVFDLLGKQLLRREINNATNCTINLSDEVKGCYLMQVTSNGQSFNRIIMKD